MWKKSVAVLWMFFSLASFLIKLWPSDRFLWTAPLAYFPPVLAVVITAAGFIFLKQQRNLFTLSIVPAIASVIFLESPFFNAPPVRQSRPETIRILHWNIWSGRRGIERIVNEISRHDPHVICLNEPKRSRAEKSYPPYAKLFEQATREEWHAWTESFMAILSKYPVEQLRSINGPGYQGLLARIKSPAQGHKILLLDISPRITSSRQSIFQQIIRELKSFDPEVIVGDFNTPAHAHSLSRLRNHYEDVAAKWTYTWPTPMPMMRLDYVFLKRGISGSNYQYGWTLLSDHAFQIVDIPSTSLQQINNDLSVLLSDLIDSNIDRSYFDFYI